MWEEHLQVEYSSTQSSMPRGRGSGGRGGATGAEGSGVPGKTEGVRELWADVVSYKHGKT